MRFLTISFFAAAVLLFFALFFHNIIEFDQDLGRHLLMGKIISQTGAVPKTNLLSYTHPDFQFINSHWLSEVLFYQISNLSGNVLSLLYLKVLTLIAAFTLTLYTAYRFSKNWLTTAISFAIFTPILLERTEIRPEIFSYLFTAIFIYILLLDKRKFLWMLPFIEVFWVNLHIYFILGPILVVIFYSQRFWATWSTSHQLQKTVQMTKHLLLITLFVCAATLLNPNGLAGAFYPFRVFDNYGYSIVENQNIFFLKDMVFNPNIFYFAIAFAVFILSFVVTDWKKITLQTLGIASLAFLPLMAIRSFPFFFLLELPIVAFNLANLNPKIKEKLTLALGELGAIMPNLGVALVIFLTLVRCLRLVSSDYYQTIDSPKRFGSEVAESGKGTLDFVSENELKGPVFNNFDIGSYVAYRLYPKVKVFTDGRPEAYPAQFFQGVYIPMQMTGENFKAVDDLFHFNTVIFSHTDATPWGQAFLTNIIKNPDYSLVYLDSYGTVFIKNEANPEMENKKITAESIESGKTPILAKTTRDLLSVAQVFYTFGWSKPGNELIQRAYKLNPNSLSATRGMSLVYMSDPSSAFLGQKLDEQYRARTSFIFF